MVVFLLIVLVLSVLLTVSSLCFIVYVWDEIQYTSTFAILLYLACLFVFASTTYLTAEALIRLG